MGFFDFLKGPDINQGVKEYSTTDGAVLLDCLLYTSDAADD